MVSSIYLDWRDGSGREEYFLFDPFNQLIIRREGKIGRQPYGGISISLESSIPFNPYKYRSNMNMIGLGPRNLVTKRVVQEPASQKHGQRKIARKTSSKVPNFLRDEDETSEQQEELPQLNMLRAISNIPISHEQNTLTGERQDNDSHKATKERVGRVSGCIVGNDSQHIITKNGCLVREFAKFDGTTWKHQPQTIKDLIAKKCTEKSNHAGNSSTIKAIMKQAGNTHKNKQYRLHLHYKKFSSREEAEKNYPENVKPDQWLLLCAKFASQHFQEKSRKNKENRSKNNTPPTVGSVSVARKIVMNSNKENRSKNNTPPTVGSVSVARKIVMNRKKGGPEPSAIDLYHWSHYSKKNKRMVNDHAEQIMEELRAEEATSSRTPAEICVQKLGGIPGHLKGRAVPTRQILASESFRIELEAEQQRRKEVEERNARMEARLASQTSELQVMKDQMALLMAKMNDSSFEQLESDSE
ncbi:hypothetical protein OROMI_008157 [Orobanche minor]